jgi:hypothetical protein
MRLPALVAITVVALSGHGLAGGAHAAPTEGAEPARARVAAQCAAFWEGAGRPDRAAPYRALSETLGGDRAFTERFIDRTRPAMERLAAERASSGRAAALWRRHAALCGGG